MSEHKSGTKGKKKMSYRERSSSGNKKQEDTVDSKDQIVLRPGVLQCKGCLQILLSTQHVKELFQLQQKNLCFELKALPKEHISDLIELVLVGELGDFDQFCVFS